MSDSDTTRNLESILDKFKDPSYLSTAIDSIAKSMADIIIQGYQMKMPYEENEIKEFRKSHSLTETARYFHLHWEIVQAICDN